MGYTKVNWTELVPITAANLATMDDGIDAATYGWTPIGAGTEIATTNFTVDSTAAGTYPAGTFSRMRLQLRGQFDADPGSTAGINLRVNGDVTGGLHRTGWIVRRVSDGGVVDSGYDDFTVWRIAEWGAVSACVCSVELSTTDVSSLVSYESVATRQSTSDTFQRKTEAGGRLNTNTLVSSLNVRTTAGAFTCRWWLEGYLDLP